MSQQNPNPGGPQAHPPGAPGQTPQSPYAPQDPDAQTGQQRGRQTGSNGQPAGGYGQPAGQYPLGGPPPGHPGGPHAPGAGQPRKNWFARHKILTAVMAVIALFVVVGIVSGGGEDDDVAPVAEETPAETPAAQDAADDEEPADEGAPAEDAQADGEAHEDDPGEDEAGNGQEGTRDNPYAAGTAIELGDYTVTLGETTTDAWEQIQAENQFNDPPADGRQFVMVPVTAAYNGDDTGWATMDLSIAFVGSGGNTFNFGSDDYCGVIPDSLNDQGEMYAGGTVEGNVCVSVEADQIDGGAWRVEETWSFSGEHAFIDLS